ncbi:hypothetical protein [Absidia glauca]|uniref:Uncharacterized protein n=1 Tax=Absidia glauca TaxID=4829 RepID=A0A163KPU3_ABSGL|nr:hypothetical protein [Absidia glauca]
MSAAGLPLAWSQTITSPSFGALSDVGVVLVEVVVKKNSNAFLLSHDTTVGVSPALSAVRVGEVDHSIWEYINEDGYDQSLEHDTPIKAAITAQLPLTVLVFPNQLNSGEGGRTFPADEFANYATHILNGSTFEVYSYCQRNNLPDAWAYLWRNWYTGEKWKLWSRSPRLDAVKIGNSDWQDHIARGISVEGTQKKPPLLSQPPQDWIFYAL